MQKLLPEWFPQEAILLAWPDQYTDWRLWLDEVRHTYLNIICALNANNTPVIMLIRDTEINTCKQLIAKSFPKSIDKLLLVPAKYNDTWLRDYGFLTCQSEQGMQTLDFQFNGWGNKFDADLDNKINQQVFSALLQNPLRSVDYVLEGGAVEIDDNGHLLSTKLCLSNPQRNGAWNKELNLALFQEQFGAKNVSILENGHLEGDDTDGHIDTLVRFTLDSSVVIQSCFNRINDIHFSGLQALVDECKSRINPKTIFELPLPYIENNDSERLPASYANFLISNGQILAPLYGEKEDAAALAVLKAAYPEFVIVPINCHYLVQQFGSLHCITMQVPCETFKPHIIEQATSGISIYEQA